MEIRRAQRSDIEGINRLLRQVLELHHEGRADLFRTGTKKYTDSELRRLVCDNRRPIFVAVEDGEVLGYVFCALIFHRGDSIFNDHTTLYIDDLCVDESGRGQGIGSLLYRRAEECARQMGCHNLTLNVWAFNESAIGFYERMGLAPQKIVMERVLR